jgi:PKD repeat protein
MMAGFVVLLALTLAPAAQAAPTVSVSASPSTVRVNGTVGLTASATPADGTTIASVAWNFGDGSGASDGLSQSHAYGSTGPKTITFTATDSNGESGSASDTVQVVGDPVASFGSSPATPNIGAAVTFDGSGSSDPGGAIRSYAWDFGDGTSGTGAKPAHAYGSGGDKTVTLTVTADLDGRTASVSHTVHVNVPPKAAFAWAAVVDPPSGQDPFTPLIGQRVAFSAQSSSDADGPTSSLRFAWDTGSGTFGAPSPTNYLITTFPVAGPRTVRLQVTDGGGSTDVATVTFRVNTLPVPSFTFAPGTPGPNQRVTFTSGTTDPDGDLAAQEWDLNGDGKFDDATGASAQAIYLTPGDYTVGLRATDSGRASAATFRTVSVVGPAVAPDPGGSGGGGQPAPTIIPSPGAAPVGSGSSPSGSSAPVAGGSTPGGAKVATTPLKAVPGVRVQIAGSVRAAITRITQLLIVAPKGASVVVRCQGGGCPAKALRRKVGRSGRLRLRGMERSLRAGAVITVSVAKEGYATRQIRLSIRSGSAPKRTQACVFPGVRKTSPCPAP